MQCVSNNTADNIQGLWILINLKIRKKHNLMSWVEAKTMLGIPEFSFSVSVFMFLYLFHVFSSTLHVFFSIFYFFSQCSLYSSLAPSQLIQQLLVGRFKSSWSADSTAPGQLIQSSRSADSTAPTAPGRPIQEFLVSWFNSSWLPNSRVPGQLIQQLLVGRFKSPCLVTSTVPACLIQQSLVDWSNSSWSEPCPIYPGHDTQTLTPEWCWWCNYDILTGGRWKPQKQSPPYYCHQRPLVSYSKHV